MNLNREIRAQYLFEKETSQLRFPQYQDGTWQSNFKLGLHEYMSLITDRSLLYRVAVGSLCVIVVPTKMHCKLLTDGRIHSIGPCSSSNGLASTLSSTTHLLSSVDLDWKVTPFRCWLLASSVLRRFSSHISNTSRFNIPCDFRMFLATIPAVIWIDKTGRKPVLVSGAFLMGA